MIELALVLPVLMLIFTGAVDFGRAFYVDMEVAAAAESGALYGLQHPTDLAGMKSAALLNAVDLPTLSPSATFGTECSDGSAAVSGTATPPSCLVSVVQYVEVDATAAYRPILYYPGLPSVITMSSKSRMRASF